MKKLLILFTFLVSAQLFALRPIDQKLIDAASEDNLQLVDQCIRDGADVNAKNIYGGTALMWASIKGHADIVIRLLQVSCINFNAKDNYGWTALIAASYEGCSNIINILLQISGIDINAKNDDDHTALSIARLLNKEKVAQLIIDSKHFDIDKFLELIPQRNKKDWTNYIHEQQRLIAEEKFKKLVQKHKSVINYLEHRELCRLRPI